MRKYTRPEMEYRAFAGESVLTASEPAADTSSKELLQQKLNEKNLGSAPRVERKWEEMGS